MRKRVLLTLLVVLVGATAGSGYVIDGTPAMPRPKSYRAAIARVLDAQHIDYRDVEVIDGCAPSEQRCRSYAGTVRVRNVTIMAGQIDCRERWVTCTITIPQVGIRGVALDDTIDPLTTRWEDVSGQFLLWLRSASRGFAERNY
jgi:hypothetical protein